MDIGTTLLIGSGGLGLLVCIVLGIFEIALLSLIRAPKKNSFSNVRMVASQYQTIVAPAMGALVASLFVSIAASYFYEGISKNEDWRQYAGLGSFFIGLICLATMLRSALKGLDDPASLASDPHTIQAAAEEYSEMPRNAVLEPDVLVQRLKRWQQRIATHSMNISADVQAPRLDEAFQKAARSHGKAKLTKASILIYCAALRQFPWRFSWPILSAMVYLAGWYWFAFGSGVLNESSIAGWLRVIVLPIIVTSLVLAFYFAARGYRAVRWHRVNRIASVKAKRALREATTMQAAVLEETENSKQLYSRVSDFLRNNGQGGRKKLLTLNVGRFSLKITSKSD